MNRDELSTRQLCFILCVFSPAGKIILLPSILARYAGNDLLFAVAIPFALEWLAVSAALWLIGKREEPLPALLEQTAGKVFSRAALFLLGLFLLFSSIVPLVEHRLYVQNVMYDVLPSVIVFLPVFLFSAYACAKGLTCAGRAADVAAPLFLLSFAVLLFMSVASADFSELLPLAKTPAKGVLQGAVSAFNWFSSGAWVLLFQGRVKKSKGFLWKTELSYVAGMLGVFFFLAVFYGIFSTVAVNEPFAISKIARYYGALNTLGRVDYLFLYVLMLAQLFALVLPLQLSAHAFADCFSCPNLMPFSLAVNGALLSAFLLTSRNASSLIDLFGLKLFPVFLVFSFLLPLLSPLLALKKKEVRREK